MKELLSIILILAVFGCNKKSNSNNVEVFKKPQIINSQFADTLNPTLFRAENVSNVFQTVVGKYKFQSIVDINPENRVTTFSKDYLIGSSRIRPNDSIDVNGLEIIIDYNKSIAYSPDYHHIPTVHEYYPVYFVNSTSTDKIFFGKDSYAFGIQEAQEKEPIYSHWRPIESRGYDFCGNGNWGLIVHPQEFVVVLMRKYEGNYETNLRVRFQIGENILVSRSFKGTIDQSQFSVLDSSYLELKLKETNGGAASWLFYGATPNEEEWAGEAL